MSQTYEQFLGSCPGLIVELVESKTSPYVIRTADGFEFIVGSEDFNNFYRPLGDKAPSRWAHLITDTETGLINTNIVAPIMDLIHSFECAFYDFHKARSFLRWSAKRIVANDNQFVRHARERLEKEARAPELISDESLQELLALDSRILTLLASETCAQILWPVGKPSDMDETVAENEPRLAHEKRGKASSPKTVKIGLPRMKNVELKIDNDTLAVSVDLSKDFGPSKSGRNNIVGTTEGNKTLPGRDERIGMTVYKEIDPKVLKKGAKDSFKNLRMEVVGDILTVYIDLTQSVGPSKSGKNIIISSTGGNQLVFTRQEKIGLNVYKPL